MPFVDLTLTKLTDGHIIQNLTLITKFHHFTLKSILQNTFHKFDHDQLGFDQLSDCSIMINSSSYQRYLNSILK